MATRNLIEGERHHWWPKSLSQNWGDEAGLIGRISSQGKVAKAVPGNLAVIRDGHNFIPARAQNKSPSPWDHTFEQEFDRSDSSFPGVIQLLRDLVESHKRSTPVGAFEFMPHRLPDKKVELLLECVLSLVIRSPRFRFLAIQPARWFGRELSGKEGRSLAAANIKGALPRILSSLADHGRFSVIFSESSEFIFGDGFYSNVHLGSAFAPYNVRFLAPITPEIAVFYSRRISRRDCAQLTTVLASEAFVNAVNETVQIYAKDELFFRKQAPTLIDAFKKAEYAEYEAGDPIPGFEELLKCSH
ncbi:MAG: hypothetical protein R3E87_02785 [Burkholderiaceae bacterium]